MKKNTIGAGQAEQLRHLVDSAFRRSSGMRTVTPEELENLGEGQVRVTVTVTAPDGAVLEPILLAGDVEKLRRATVPEAQALRCGGLEVDFARQTALVDGQRIPLTPREFQLLAHLVRNPNIVMTREQLLGAVWDLGFPGGTRTVDTHIKCLRRKLGPYSSRIITVRKLGYRFEMD